MAPVTCFRPTFKAAEAEKPTSQSPAQAKGGLAWGTLCWLNGRGRPLPRGPVSCSEHLIVRASNSKGWASNGQQTQKRQAESVKIPGRSDCLGLLEA